jgi:rubrerythrin
MEKSAQNRRKIGALDPRQMEALAVLCAIFRKPLKGFSNKNGAKIGARPFTASFAEFKIGAKSAQNRRTSLAIQRPPYRDPSLPPPIPVNGGLTEMWRCPVCNPARLNYQHCSFCPMCGEPNPTPKDRK